MQIFTATVNICHVFLITPSYSLGGHFEGDGLYFEECPGGLQGAQPRPWPRGGGGQGGRGEE